MKSLNFEFLRPEWPELAGLAGFAEQYAFADPASALVKLRTYLEQLVERIYDRLGFQRPIQPSLLDLLNESAFVGAVPEVVRTSMHAIRMNGNRAAHGAEGSTETVLWLLQEAHKLGRWLYLTSTGNKVESVAPYVASTLESVGGPSKGRLQREKKAVLQRLAAQEAQMQKILDDLATARKEAHAARATADELEIRLRAAQQYATVLDFNETQTRRRLIDSLLVGAGWDVGANGQSTQEVGQEAEVHHQPTQSGIGAADYVLWDDNGKPLAVIEAKKTAVDPEVGRTQAKCYADGLEKDNSQRPFIFYTNGFDIWMWDDAAGYTPRKLYGFYSKDSLGTLIRQRDKRAGQPLTNIIPDKIIAGRLYQTEAVRRVLDRFQNRYRKGLLVQATGTGKTRVAISISEALMRAGWATRILFLCDRRALRKQAHNAFKRFMPDEPRVYVTSQTYRDREHRIYLATYPAMMKCFETFDVGFFDLIIADESHRSIYNRYQDLLRYFDALQVGLTATPRRDLIWHNTYALFDCEDGNPTAFYSYEEARKDGWLSPLEVETFTTPFLREGIKYSQMSEEQRRQLEENEAMPESIEYEQHQVDKYVFNKDSNRRILENLMTNGIKVANGSRLGKTIVFARNHNHAVLLQNLFDEMYPQYGGNFCRVIDNYDPRADELIDDLKGEGRNPDLTVAISVDMLDTGLDIPEIVNLVFAKPVYSYIKFWQMIGRGTRLCPDLFGPGQDKKRFLIFDHWGNFEHFEENYREAEQRTGKSLQQIVFENRIRLAEVAIDAQNAAAFELATDLLLADVRALPDKALAVRDKWREVKTVQTDGVIRQFAPATKALLQTAIAPLMQWRNITGKLPAYNFDRLCCQLQAELLRSSSRAADLRADLVNLVAQLRINLNPVKAKLVVIERVKSGLFWTAPTVQDIEDVRTELRGIMQYRAGGEGGPGTPPKVLDVAEDESLIERKKYVPRFEGMDLLAYRDRVQRVLVELIDASPALQKIKAGQPVRKEELDEIVALVVAQEPGLVLSDLIEYFPDTAGDLGLAIRGIIGMDAEAVDRQFTAFAQNYRLNAMQIRFLDLLKNHIREYGSIELDRLYDAPFTSLSDEGLDGVFPDQQQADELIRLVESFAQTRKEPPNT